MKVIVHAFFPSVLMASVRPSLGRRAPTNPRCSPACATPSFNFIPNFSVCGIWFSFKRVCRKRSRLWRSSGSAWCMRCNSFRQRPRRLAPSLAGLTQCWQPLRLPTDLERRLHPRRCYSSSFPLARASRGHSSTRCSPLVFQARICRQLRPR